MRAPYCSSGNPVRKGTGRNPVIPVSTWRSCLVYCLLSVCMTGVATSLLFLSVPAGAIMTTIPVPELVSESDAIITGTIVDSTPQWDEGHLNIETVTTVRVMDVLKGPIPPGARIEIMTLGGTIDGTSQWVEDMPVLSKGSEVGLFLRGPSNRSDLAGTAGISPGQYKITGAYQGVYYLGRPSKGGTGNVPDSREAFIGMVRAGGKGIVPDASLPLTGTPEKPVRTSPPGSTPVGPNPSTDQGWLEALRGFWRSIEIFFGQIVHRS